MKTKLISVFIAMAVFFVISSCNKSDSGSTKTIPDKFVDLKIDPNFDFDSFKNLSTSIKIPVNKQTSTTIVQIFNANPASGGRLILTGSLNQNNEFHSEMRIPAYLTEVYVGKVSSDGLNEYVAVPVTDGALDFTFGQKEAKSVTAVLGNDCGDGSCTTTVSGTQSNKTIQSGEYWCVAEGTNAVFNDLEIKSGGTLRICGTATINSVDNDGGEGSLIVTPLGTLTMAKHDNEMDIENYGILNVSGGGGSDFKIKGTLQNWGTMTISRKFENEGTITNHGSFTVTKQFKNKDDGIFTNNCSLYVTKTGDGAFEQEGKFTNNGFVDVTGNVTLKADGSNKGTFFGLQSLFECHKFEIEGYLEGPNSQGSQIHGVGSTNNGQKSKVNEDGEIAGFVDLWANYLDIDNDATIGNNVTEHDPGYTIPTPVCNMATAPSITSSLQIGGLANQPMADYVITATGTEPITYTATNLPAGLIYNSTTHTISGTPTTAGVYNVNLIADNFMGTDEKTLVITVTQPADPPVITSVLTASATVGQSFSYLMTATGTGPITYAASGLPDGLSFDPDTQLITGSPTTAGTYTIVLTATNGGGTDTKNLILTAGTAPEIISDLTASGVVDQTFPTYYLDATGSPNITYTVLNLPDLLVFDPTTNTINGNPTNAGTTSVTLTATNAYGSDSKELVITIVAAPQAPEITSVLNAAGVVNQSFSYTITATGDDPITYGTSTLPPGLTFSGATISGLPTTAGNYSVTLTASNGVGTDTKTLLIVITGTGGDTDTDGDTVPDNIDAYPTDPERAFNSFYPNEVDFGSFVFEDLWPSYGDYDMNDLVVNFNYKTVTNAQNEVVDIIAKLQIMAAGATLNNGFGIVLNTPSANVGSVTGYIKMSNGVILDPKGFEVGHTNETVIIAFDAVNDILGNGLVNTVPGGLVVQTDVKTVTINLSNPQANIGLPPYNPFIFVDQVRGHEIHLKDMAPTELVDNTLFGNAPDASDPAQGHYYRSETGLPWGIEVPVNFDYPVEEVDILVTYLHFAEWAQSSGVDYPDWYEDKAGYRNDSNLYKNN